jgi:hypothetical protein
MSCYLPLVQRWRRPAEPAPPPAPEPRGREERRAGRAARGVEATRDRRGITLSQTVGDVTLHIRHDHPALDLGDVAYQRQHQEHTRRRQLTLPLGISSLRGEGRGSESEPEGRARARGAVSHFYQALAGSTATISQHQRLREYGEAPPGGRPRRAKLPSAVPARPASVDAELLVGGGGREDGRRLKFAALTSPQSYMRSGGQDTRDEKSSSGNSSGSDITSEGSPVYPPSEEGEGSVHPAVRGRAPAPAAPGSQAPPPPRHLLPARLRPSPLVKLHPLVVLPALLRQGRHLGRPAGPILSWSGRRSALLPQAGRISQSLIKRLDSGEVCNVVCAWCLQCSAV